MALTANSYTAEKGYFFRQGIVSGVGANQIADLLSSARSKNTFRRQKDIIAENLILTHTAANLQAHQKMS